MCCKQLIIVSQHTIHTKSILYLTHEMASGSKRLPTLYED